MEIIEVNATQYAQIIAAPYNIFGSAAFNELNKDKCDKLFYLLFKDSKYRLGLIVGSRNNAVYSPFSAPFGGFTFLSEDIRLQAIDQALEAMNDWATENKFNSIHITLPPSIYHESFVAKQTNCLFRNGYVISKIDLNYSFKVCDFSENYPNTIWSNARNKLKISLRSGLTFMKCESDKDKKIAYEIIKKNREERNFPLRMTWKQLSETTQLIHADFFIVYDINQITVIASAIIFRINNDISQVIYWGDLPQFATNKTMNFLSYKVFEYYKKEGKKIIDIGPSTENSIPNYGLCEFKEGIGANITSKFSFEKKYNMRVEFIAYDKTYLELSYHWLNDPEIKLLTNSPDFTKEDQKRWFDSLQSKMDYLIWGIKADNIKIGVCGLKNITTIDCEYWGYIGNKTYWGKGIGAEIMKTLEDRAQLLEVKSIWLQVLKSNERAIKLYHKNGYSIESTNSDFLIMRKML